MGAGHRQHKSCLFYVLSDKAIWNLTRNGMIDTTDGRQLAYIRFFYGVNEYTVGRLRDIMEKKLAKGINTACTFFSILL